MTRLLLSMALLATSVFAQRTKANPKDGLTCVWIPPGKFLMSCSPSDTECFDWELHSPPINASSEPIPAFIAGPIFRLNGSVGSTQRNTAPPWTCGFGPARSGNLPREEETPGRATAIFNQPPGSTPTAAIGLIRCARSSPTDTASTTLWGTWDYDINAAEVVMIPPAPANSLRNFAAAVDSNSLIASVTSSTRRPVFSSPSTAFFTQTSVTTPQTM